MMIEKLQSELGYEEFPELWRELLPEVSKGLAELSDELLGEQRISEIIDEYGILVPYKNEVILAAREIAESEYLSLYLCLINKTMQLGRIGETPVKAIPGGSAAARFGLILPHLMNVPRSVEFLREHSVTEEMIRGTLYEFDRAIEVYSAKAGGVLAFPVSSFNWLQLIYENRLVRMGRLNFELRYCFFEKIKVFRSSSGEIKTLAHGITVHKSGRVLGAAGFEDEDGSFAANVEETESAYIGYPADSKGFFLKEAVTLPKSEWEKVLEYGDKVIAVHIPTGGALTPEECEKSYALAREYFPKCFPGFDYKAFSCVSWMVDTQLAEVSKPGSNIVAFLEKYIPFKREAPGVGVFSFVFMLNPAIDIKALDYKTLPEDSSLRRAIKQHYIDGKRIYEDGGFFF